MGSCESDVMTRLSKVRMEVIVSLAAELIDLQSARIVETQIRREGEAVT